MEPTVFVLTPSFNHVRFLSRRIRSILGQGWRRLTLQIIDDASTDGSAVFLRSFSDPRCSCETRQVNSGSPFSAWREVLDHPDLLKSAYVWIAESDDFAESSFLEQAVRVLEADARRVLYYCHSNIVDDQDNETGHSRAYLFDQFPHINWDEGFEMEGADFVRQLAIWGQPVPNMSSVLMRTDAFRTAVQHIPEHYKLAADWIIVARVAIQGRVVFSPQTLNNFRIHDRTARQETGVERRVVEYLVAIEEISSLVACDQRRVRASAVRVLKHFFLKRGDLRNVLKVLKAGERAALTRLFRRMLHLGQGRSAVL